ncbi:uncharacterized protein [Ptychodera flava]|uniref:uncharacterized protein n=1 Tax=Ptychodera flava TaxID=63121 RepID=UPI003969CFDA
MIFQCCQGFTMAREHRSISKILLIVVSLCMIPVSQSLQECYIQNEPITTDQTMSLIIKSNIDVCLQYGINFTILSGISTNRNTSNVCVTAIEEGDESTEVVSCDSNINGTKDDVQKVIQINGQYAFPVYTPRHSVTFSWRSPDTSSPQPQHVTRVYISAHNHCNISTEEGREVAVVYKLTTEYIDIAMDDDSGHTLHFVQSNELTCLHVPGVYSYSYNKESYYIAVFRNITCKMPTRCFKVKMTPFGNVPLEIEEVSLYIQESVNVLIYTSQKQEIKYSGDSFELNCDSTEGFESISWIKDDISVQEDEMHIITSERGFSTLAIARLALADQGTYQCMVQTICGVIKSDKYTLNLPVLVGKPCKCHYKENSTNLYERPNNSSIPSTPAGVTDVDGWHFDIKTAIITSATVVLLLSILMIAVLTKKCRNCMKKQWCERKRSKDGPIELIKYNKISDGVTIQLLAAAPRQHDSNPSDQ